MALPANFAPRTNDIQKIDMHKDLVTNGGRFIFDLKIVATTDKLVEPNAIKINLQAYITAAIALNYTKEMDPSWVRAAYNPKSEAYVVNVPAAFTDIVPDCLPVDIFILEPDSKAKFKLNYMGAHKGPAAKDGAEAIGWAHMFVNTACAAGPGEIKDAVTATFARAYLRVMTGTHDFKLLDTGRGKWQINFTGDIDNDYWRIAECLHYLRKVTINGSDCKVILSREFLETRMKGNCNGCYANTHFAECICKKDKKGATSSQAAKRRVENAQNAERRLKASKALAEDASF